MSPEERAFREMSPVDQIKFQRELANKREYSPEEAKENLVKTLMGLAYSTPVVANAMAIRDYYEAKERMDKEVGPTKAKRQAQSQAIVAALSAVLPFNIGSPASGSSLRMGTFVPVLEKGRADAARNLHQELPRRYTRPDLANKEVSRQTGIVFGGEGVPRDVLSDKNMRIINSLQGGETRPLSSLVEHPELFGRVEGMGDIPVEVLPAIKARSGEGFHRPIARTTQDGGFQVSENARPRWLREQMAKLMQYEIGRRSGFAPAARHGIANNIERIDQTVDAISKGMESGRLPADAAMAFIDRLTKTRKRIVMATEAAASDPSASPWLRDMVEGGRFQRSNPERAVSKALNARMAGNVDAEIAKRYVHTPDAAYPYSGHSLGEMIVLPDQIEDMGKLAEFLKTWRTYGQGAPQGAR